MEAGGTWTRQGYTAPWMYHSVPGQYTLLEKPLISDLSPYRRRPVSRVLQDSTNWHNAQLPLRWGLTKQESQWLSVKDLSRGTSSPKAQRQPPLWPPPQCSPTYEGLRPISMRDGSWGANSPPGRDGPIGFLAGGSFAAAPSCHWYPGGTSAKNRVHPPTRAPPSYEAHMLLRLRAGQGPRKENWPHPPPYVAPPSYEAPHRTVQPQSKLMPCQRPHKEALTGKQIQAVGPKKYGERVTGTCETGGSLSHAPGRKAGRRQVKIPGSWSYLSGASTWGGHWREPQRSESACGLMSSWDMSPQHQSHTLPRVSKRNKGLPVPVPCPPQHTLPVGWGFSHAVGWPPGDVRDGGSKAGDKHSRSILPKWKEPSHARDPAGSQGSLSKLVPQKRGGLFVIDATCVVIQAHYIPAPRTERVRYLGQEGLDKVKSPLSPGPAAPASMEERAARILGLSVSELGFTEVGRGNSMGPGVPEQKVNEGSTANLAVLKDICGAGQHKGAPSPPASPREKTILTPTPNNFQIEPTQQVLHNPEKTVTPAVPCQESGCAQLQQKEEPEPVFSPQSRSYALDLKEAMSRIRRHTAPDSDTDEEIEKDCQPVCGRPAEWRGRLNEGALSYSSSSLDSSSSNATVVPGNATPTPRNQSEEPPVRERSNNGPGSVMAMKTD